MQLSVKLSFRNYKSCRTYHGHNISRSKRCTGNNTSSFYY